MPRSMRSFSNLWGLAPWSTIHRGERTDQPAPAVGLSLFPTSGLVRATRARNEDVIRALTTNAYLGNGNALCRVLGRYKMFVDTNDVGLSAHLMIDGYWEMWLTEAMVDTIKPGMLAVDVGANLGYFSILMAELVGEAGQVHAFEPNETVVRKLRRSSSANGFRRRIHAHAVALADAEVDHHFVVQDDDPKNAFIIRAAPGTPQAPDMLKTRRMDSFEDLLLADVVKIDADTAEQAIWRGMRGIFDQKRPMTVFLEFNAVRYHDPKGFLDEILAEGFTLSIVHLTEGIKDIEIEELVTSGDGEDQMLIIRR